MERWHFISWNDLSSEFILAGAMPPSSAEPLGRFEHDERNESQREQVPSLVPLWSHGLEQAAEEFHVMLQQQLQGKEPAYDERQLNVGLPWHTPQWLNLAAVAETLLTRSERFSR